MRARLIVVSGTGTSIGKTHLADGLLRAWGRRGRVAGLKPIETGVSDPDASDASRLRRASTFHVKQFGCVFAPPLSPHLAARREGVVIDIATLVEAVDDVRRRADGVLVELAGGLFTPIADRLFNVDLSAALDPDLVLLVAPDRIGVLHDVIAVSRAAAAAGLRLDGVVLVAPEQPDASTGTNAAELPTVSGLPVMASFPRAPSARLAELPEMAQILDAASHRSSR